METNLYEVLGLTRDATSEQIRKAYRKRALQTHPDRLPPNISPAEKAAAEEAFRKVNNAYEVLNDDENRKLYDRYGVWPPPTAEPEPQRRQSHRQDSFDSFRSDPFFNMSFGSRHPFTFTDPFVLFNSLFGDIHRRFFDDDFDEPLSSPFGSRSPFDTMMGDPFGRSMFGGSLLGGGPSMLLGPGSMFSQLMDGNTPSRSYSSVSQAVGRNGRWVAQSTMTRSINGRTETITKRRDAEGNEHVTYSSPDGERYTINGVEQPLPNGHAITSAPSPPPPAQPQTRSAPQAITAPPPPPPTSSYVPPPNNYYAPPQPQPYPQAQPHTQPQVYSQPPPQPQYQPPPQPYPSYTSPPQADRYSTTSSHFTYPTKPQPPVEPVPVQHQQRFGYAPDPTYHDPGVTARRTSSHGHGNGHHVYDGAHTHSHSHSHSHRDRDRDRERAHSLRSSHSESPRSHRDSHRERDREKGEHGREKKWRVGWLNDIANFLKTRVRPHHTH